MMSRGLALRAVLALLHLAPPLGAEAFAVSRSVTLRARPTSALVRLHTPAVARGTLPRRAAPPLAGLAMMDRSQLQRDALNLELQNAIQLNDLLMIQDMVQADSVEAGLALARVAQLGGSDEMLRLLLQLGAQPDATDEFGRTAVLLAVSRGDKRMTETLLSAGANVEGVGGTYNGRTALMQAACSGATDLVTLLLKNGADPFATDRYGRNVIQQAAVMHRESVVRTLERHIKDSEERSSKTGRPGQSSTRASGSFFGLFGTSPSQTPPPPLMENKEPSRGVLESQLWESIFSESAPVPGRTDVFEWRGRILRHPEIDDQGMCIIVEENTNDIVYRGGPPQPSNEGDDAKRPRATPTEDAPDVPDLLQAVPETERPMVVDKVGDDVARLDAQTEARLWSSILKDSEPVPGRPEVFAWRGKLLRQPTFGADGQCIIVDDTSGEVVFKGGPPPKDAISVPHTTADRGQGGSTTLNVVKGTVRVLASPVVAVARLTTAAVDKVSSKPGSDGQQLQQSKPPLFPVSGTMSAMAAAWQSVGLGSKASGRAAASNDGFGASGMGMSGMPRSGMPSGEPAQPERDVRTDGVVWKGLEAHVSDVKELARKVQGRAAGQMVTTRRGKGDSHCPRDFSYKQETMQVDVEGLDAVIGVRQVQDGGWEMLVEPRVTMEQLVRACAAYNLRPPVVPEFRKITVGGSIAGIAGESTSFKYGFFHDSCTGYEIILGDGSIVTATPDNEYADLFHATPGSYGSLGLVTAASIRLIPALPYVAMAYTHFDRVSDLMSYLAEANERPTTDFIEGIGYSPSSFVACEGMEVSADSAQAGVYGKMRRLSRFYSPWFYRNVQKKRGDMVRDPLSVCDVIPLEDYLFRHDRGSFWMASYKMPSLVGRGLGFLLSSHNMYKMATALPSVFDKSEILLQDFMMPVGNVGEFVNRLNNKLGVWPLWFCPLKNYGAPGPIFGVPLNNGDYCNVGAYGIPRRKVFDFEEDNKRMEVDMLQLDGRKVHYSHAYYPVEAFYSVIYDGDKYALLRDKYKADDAFPHVYDKIITKSGRL